MTKEQAQESLYDLIAQCATRATKAVKAGGEINVTYADCLMETAQRAANVSATLVDGQPMEMEPTP